MNPLTREPFPPHVRSRFDPVHSFACKLWKIVMSFFRGADVHRIGERILAISINDVMFVSVFTDGAYKTIKVGHIQGGTLRITFASSSVLIDDILKQWRPLDPTLRRAYGHNGGILVERRPGGGVGAKWNVMRRNEFLEAVVSCIKPER